MKTMISVSEAKQHILEYVAALSPCNMHVSDAVGSVLAEDIFSPLDIPAYPQSSMDGYAFAFEVRRTQYEIMGEIPAGSDKQFILLQGKAVRIFTGAAVPEGADTVLMQEKAVVDNNNLLINDPNISKGTNVRPVGSEIAKGEKALVAGHRLNPASIGFLTGMGIETVKVYPRPRVAIVVTGNELQEIGKPLGYGQVYDSNSWTLMAALDQLLIKDVKIWKSGDDLIALQTSLREALDDADLVLMTGGVSVGDYDFTLDAFEACGVEKIFHKIKQKPGKPILFGKKERKLVFGLPGNPASVLTCFYEYVLPAIGFMMQGAKQLNAIHVPLAHDHQKPAGLTHFLKAVYDGEYVSLQSGQESYKLSSFAVANCLAVLPETDTHFIKDQLIEIHLLP